MPPRKEKEVPVVDRLASAIQSLEGLESPGAMYDREALMGSHLVVTELAEEGLTANEFDQVKSIEYKLEATKQAKEIADSNGDKVTAIALNHLEQTLGTLLKVITPVESPEPAQPATTSRSRTGGAKSPSGR